MDQFFNSPAGVRHRCKLHHEHGVELVRQLFGNMEAQAARLHVEDDLHLERGAKLPRNELEFKEMGFM